MIYSGRHVAHLAVASFHQNQLKPCGRNGLAESNGRIAWRQNRIFGQQPNLRRSSAIALNREARAEAIKREIIRHALNLCPIGARMLEPGIRKPVLEPAIVGKKEQSFTISIQPPNGIDISDRNVILQSLACAGKLAQNAIRLIEKDVAQVSDYILEGSRRQNYVPARRALLPLGGRSGGDCVYCCAIIHVGHCGIVLAALFGVEV